MLKRRIRMIRGDGESPPANPGDPPESHNGGSPNGGARPAPDPAESVHPGQPDTPSDREADTNEFMLPGLKAPDDHEVPDFKPEGVMAGGPAAPPEEAEPRAPQAPPEPTPAPEQRVTTKHEWHVDDGTEDDSHAFVPAGTPAPAETPDPKPAGRPQPVEPPAPVPEEPPAPATPRIHTSERIQRAELVAARAAEQQALEEIAGLEDELERAKSEGAARAEALETKLREAEERADAKAVDADQRAHEIAEAKALSEQAREGAAQWLRGQVEEIERAAEGRAHQEADQRVEAETADLRRELEELKKELSRRVREAEERVTEEAVNAQAELEARETLRSREEELVRRRAAIEGELEATRRRLEEAQDSAASKTEPTEITPPAWVMEPPAESPERQPDEPVAEETGAHAESDPAPEAEPAPKAEPVPEGTLSLSSASYDELRDAGLSVTQAKRVIRHREEHGGFGRVDELDRIRGFSNKFLADVKGRVVP